MGCNELSYIQRTVDTVTDRLIEKNNYQMRRTSEVFSCLTNAGKGNTNEYK